jgi:hypothetical protein
LRFAEFGDVHEVVCGLQRPPELAFKPWKPIAMTAQLLRRDQTEANLDDVVNRPLAEPTDFVGMRG